jgi:hypothetical protein
MKAIPFHSLLVASTLSVATAADVDLYAVSKAQSFTQTSAAAPVLLPAGGYAFASIVSKHTSTSVSSATLKLPSLVVKAFGPVAGVGSFAVAQTFDTEAALDAEYSAGNYQFTINAVTDGTKTPTLNLPASAYPNTPTVTNFLAAQNIDWTQDFTLTWGTFVGGTGGLLGDNIQVTIKRKNGTTLFATPQYGSAGALDGTATSVTIPANTFVPGESYTASLYFGNITNIDFTSYGLLLGVPGVTAFIKTTEFPMKAPGTIPHLEIAKDITPGSYDLTWNADIGRTYDLVWTADLSPTVVSWTRVALVTATATTETVTDTPSGSPAVRFYRLQDPP